MLELLEREGELEIVQALLDACVAGEGSFLVVEGPAGIGKSSLLAAGRARAGAAGLSVLQARGSELEQAFAYGLVRQLFEPVVPREPTERATVFREAAARATRVFDPDVDDTPAGGDEAFALVQSPRAARCCWSSTTSSGPTTRHCAGSATSPAVSRATRSASSRLRGRLATRIRC